DPADNSVTPLPVQLPGTFNMSQLAFDTAARRLYITQPSDPWGQNFLSIVDVASQAAVGTGPLTNFPAALTVNPASPQVYGHSPPGDPAAGGNVVETRDGDGTLVALTPSPVQAFPGTRFLYDAGRLYIAGFDSNGPLLAAKGVDDADFTAITIDLRPFAM